MKHFLFILFLFHAVLLFGQEEPIKKRIIPDIAVLQYAGSIGFISAGIGYEFFNKKANLDILVGYVPRFTGSDNITTIATKFTFNPWHIRMRTHNIVWHPVTAGLYLTYSFGSEFYTIWPPHYPEDYYWWSEAIRPNIFIGGAIDIPTPRVHKGTRLIPYYEIGTNEVKLISYAQNASTLHFWQILHASVGVRFRFRD